MAGREKIKTFQYSREGKFIAKYESISEVREKYYSDHNGKYPIFHRNKDYHFLPNGDILLKKRMYRDRIVSLIHTIENPLVFEDKDVAPIEVKNIKGETIATFVNTKAMEVLTGMRNSRIWSLLHRNKKNLAPKNKLKIKIQFIDNED